EAQSISTTTYQIFFLLTFNSIHIGVVTVRQYGNEDFHGNELSGLLIHNMQTLPSKITEHLLSGLAFEFNRAFRLVILTLVMFHKLRVAIRVISCLRVFLIMILKSKPGIVPCFVYHFEIAHQLILSSCINGGT